MKDPGQIKRLVSFKWTFGVCGFWVLACLVGFLIWRGMEQKAEKATRGENSPALLITPAQQHLGKLNQFEKKDFTFTVQNQGEEPIHILKVEKSCGCTEAMVDKEVLAPGEIGRITGSLNAENRVGEFGSQITVTYREGNREETDITKMLAGARAVTLVNKPNHLDLGSTVLGKKPMPVVFEVSKGESEVDWDGLEIEAGGLDAVVKSLGKDRWQVSVTPPHGEVIGSSREDLSLKLLNSRNPETVVRRETLSASWKTVSENFSVSPSGVYLSGDRVAKVRIKSMLGRPVEIARMEIPPDAPVQVKQVKEDGLLGLEFQNFQSKEKPQNKGSWSGKIQLILREGFVEEKWQIRVVK